MTPKNNKQFNKEQFEFAPKDNLRFDLKFETKPVGYFKDALMRFSKNKGSVVAAAILFLLIGFAITAPLVSQYETDETYRQYSYLLPKNPMFEGSGF